MKTPKTRAAMIEFLAGHFRYSTMTRKVLAPKEG